MTATQNEIAELITQLQSKLDKAFPELDGALVIGIPKKHCRLSIRIIIKTDNPNFHSDAIVSVFDELGTDVTQLLNAALETTKTITTIA